MISFSDLNLLENPFKNITPIPGQNIEEELPWAGMKKVKKEIADIYRKGIESSPRQIILNWGPYGGGKTFSSYHFLNQNFKTDKDILQVYVRSPKSGNSADIEFFRTILDFITFSKIRSRIKNLIENNSENEIFKLVNSRIVSEEFTEAILKIGEVKEENTEYIRRYLYTGLTKTELRKVGLHRNLDTPTDLIKLLTGIFICFIGSEKYGQGKIFLWVDEMEDLIYFTKKEYTAFSRLLRDLIDSLNNHFTLFMNFTLAEPDESTIEILLGDAINSRIDKRVRFDELNYEDALEYCSDLIHYYQIEKKKTIEPFTENALKLIFESIRGVDLIPRQINKKCSNLINYCIDNEITLIDEKVTAKWLNSQDE
ncbi:MAG: hypothetical protein WD607_02415 [Candidatus Paceibacterota bacterium]